MSSNIAEKIGIANTFISYPRLQELENAIIHCHDASRYFTTPECLFIYGPSGTGKTTLCMNYARRYPSVMTEAGTVLPVLSTPIPVSIKVDEVPKKASKFSGKQACVIYLPNMLFSGI
jgi:energy-coupling factor transporter ATP-binding protein EcfA2